MIISGYMYVAAIVACGEADQERQLSSNRSAGRQRFVLGQPLTGNDYHCHWGDGGVDANALNHLSVARLKHWVLR